MLMHAIAHGGCMNTVRQPALKVDSERERHTQRHRERDRQTDRQRHREKEAGWRGGGGGMPHRGPELASVMRQAFRPDALPTEPSRPWMSSYSTTARTRVP